jgi:predicted exporter
MTSVIVSTGFAVLMLSRFEVLYMVGLMTMVSAVTAVIMDLFVFPTLIGRAWRPFPTDRAVSESIEVKRHEDARWNSPATI